MERLPPALRAELRSELDAIVRRRDGEALAAFAKRGDYSRLTADEALDVAHGSGFELELHEKYIELRMMTMEFHRAAEYEKLEKSIAELEARPQTSYKGVWAEAEQYRPGDMVTFQGSCWACREISVKGVRPGSSVAWVLAVKRGADGKDGK